MLRFYPGADGRFRLYEDDGVSFGYRRGDWMGIDLGWDDRGRRLSLRLAEGSRMRAPLERPIRVERADERTPKTVTFAGRDVEVSW
jgi:hypothetical protein